MAQDAPDKRNNPGYNTWKHSSKLSSSSADTTPVACQVLEEVPVDDIRTNHNEIISIITEINNHIVDERYDPEIHNTNNIEGRSIPFVGLDEIEYNPGLFSRTALNFDYGGKSNFVRAIEVGLAADIYVKPIEIMAYEDPHQFFITAFVGLEFGGRKYDGENKDNSINLE